MFSQGLILVMKNDVTQMSTIFIFTLLCSLQGIVQHITQCFRAYGPNFLLDIVFKAFIMAGLFA